MNVTIRTIARKAMPLDFGFLLFGIVFGLLTGGLDVMLGESADQAMGAGIAYLVSLSIGSWLSINLSFVVFDLLERWAVKLLKRMESLQSRLASDNNSDEDEESARSMSKGKSFLEFRSVLCP